MTTRRHTRRRKRRRLTKRRRNPRRGRKGSRSKTRKGRLNFLTHLGSRVYDQAGHFVRKLRKPFTRRRRHRRRRRRRRQTGGAPGGCGPDATVNCSTAPTGAGCTGMTEKC